jgi:hypothetical protein
MLSGGWGHRAGKEQRVFGWETNSAPYSIQNYISSNPLVSGVEKR